MIVIYSVKITVIKKSFDEDLAKMYLTDGIEAVRPICFLIERIE